MANISNLVIGKASVSSTGIFKIDGKKYAITDAFAETLKKLTLDERTAIFHLDEDGKVQRVTLNGCVNCKGVDTPHFNGEGTYKADYVAVVGTACNLKDGNPLRFAMMTSTKKKGAEDYERTFYDMKAWEDLADSARVELAVPEGEKKPKAWAIARESMYNGRKQYTVIDYGVIAAE